LKLDITIDDEERLISVSNESIFIHQTVEWHVHPEEVQDPFIRLDVGIWEIGEEADDMEGGEECHEKYIDIPSDETLPVLEYSHLALRLVPFERSGIDFWCACYEKSQGSQYNVRHIVIVIWSNKQLWGDKGLLYARSNLKLWEMILYFHELYWVLVSKQN
jgi:hypothetical protein